MSAADPLQIRRWQDAVARDPGNPAFLPLAEIYRREGRLDVAHRLCVRGLERQPELVAAHFLLGRIYREMGDQERAVDEFDIALRLDPAHRGARRALGYISLERRDWPAAVRHLEIAAARDPQDDRAASALALARRRAAAPAAPPPPPEEDVRAVEEALQRFVRESRVRLALLMDASGRIVAQHGFAADLDLAAFSTLGAGIHSASRALARLLGQPRFEQLYQGREEHQIFLGALSTPAGERILVGVFGAETTIGMVRVLFHDFTRDIEAVHDSGTGSPRPDAERFEADLAAGLRRARPEGTGAASNLR
ncbi:MAG TPA: tetratricopeptide repeat protein [Longimicrobiaceae bacterium]|nr:tetratricopeptide repeat protein [Longimicrobiaceae bacterium]